MQVGCKLDGEDILEADLAASLMEWMWRVRETSWVATWNVGVTSGRVKNGERRWGSVPAEILHSWYTNQRQGWYTLFGGWRHTLLKLTYKD